MGLYGGGGGGGETKFEWNDDLAPYWRQLLGESGREYQQGYQGYGGDRIADINPDQQSAMDLTRNYVMSSGNNATKAAHDQLAQTVSGQYLDANPYAGESNPWASAGITPGYNQFMGESPEFQKQVDYALGDISKYYREATDPSLKAAAVLNGTLGGGDHIVQQGKNEENLAKELSRTASGMRDSQWQRSGMFREADLARDLEAQTTNKTLGGQWYDNMLDRGSNAWMNERGNMMGAMPYAQAEQGLALDRYRTLMGIGDIQRGVNQQELDLGYQNWMDQQNWRKNQLGWMGGMMSAAQGGMAPNQYTTPAGSGFSPFANMMGAGLASYGMFRA